jgi:hypothetical protein
MRRIGAIAAVLVALAAGSGTAAACDHGGGSRTLAATFTARHHGFFFRTITAYLDLSPAALRAQLASGKSLAQIATAQGKSVGGLVDAIVAAKKARLDALVSAGVITSAQESTFLASLRTRVTAFVNVSWTMRPSRAWH